MNLLIFKKKSHSDFCNDNYNNTELNIINNKYIKDSETSKNILNESKDNIKLQNNDNRIYQTKDNLEKDLKNYIISQKKTN